MASTVDTVELVGGNLALDLVNTGSQREGGPFRERLHTYADLVTWAERVGLIGTEEGARLRTEAVARPDEAEQVLEQARSFRERVYRTFSAEVRGRAPSPEDLAALSEAAADAAARRVLAPEPDGYVFTWRAREGLDRLLWPVALSAANLLVSDDLARVKECATENCNWLFVDMSRNRSRRWCDMKDCGNRAKARRHYARSRGT